MNLEIGDIFYLEIAYEDDPSQSKKRPVIIIDESEDGIFLLVSTTSKPRNNTLTFHDRYKIPILNWQKSGLKKPSWCKAKRLFAIPKSVIETTVKKSDYIGKLTPGDLEFIIKEIERLHQS